MNATEARTLADRMSGPFTDAEAAARLRDIRTMINVEASEGKTRTSQFAFNTNPSFYKRLPTPDQWRAIAAALRADGFTVTEEVQDKEDGFTECDAVISW